MPPITAASLAKNLKAGKSFTIGLNPAQPDRLDALLGLISNAQSPPVPLTLTVNLDGGTYSSQTVTPPARLTVLLENGTLVGDSPALTVGASQGHVDVVHATLSNNTAAPTILVAGGNLRLRDDTVQATVPGQAAIAITAGTANLGTAARPGGNLFDSNGLLISSTGPNPITALGNTFKNNGATLTNPFSIQTSIFDDLYAGGGGLVTYVAGNVYVTPQTGSIQRAVNAVPDRYTINVQAGGSYGNYTVGSRLLTVAFQNGPTLQLAADSALLPFSTTLRVTGGPQDNTHISFQAGAQAGTIAVALNGLPTGTFAPTGGIVAHGGGGQNAHITVAAQVTLDALLFADGPNAVLQGGGGPTIEVGGGGTSTVLEGGTGPNVLIAGSGRRYPGRQWHAKPSDRGRRRPATFAAAVQPGSDAGTDLVGLVVELCHLCRAGRGHTRFPCRQPRRPIAEWRGEPPGRARRTRSVLRFGHGPFARGRAPGYRRAPAERRIKRREPRGYSV